MEKLNVLLYTYQLYTLWAIQYSGNQAQKARCFMNPSHYPFA